MISLLLHIYLFIGIVLTHNTEKNTGLVYETLSIFLLSILISPIIFPIILIGFKLNKEDDNEETI